MRSRKKWMVPCLLLLLAAGLGAWYRSARSSQVELEDLARLAGQVVAVDAAADPDEREPAAAEAKAELVAKTREYVAANMKKIMEKSVQQRAEEAERFLALSPQEQVLRLDETIEQQEAMRREQIARKAKGPDLGEPAAGKGAWTPSDLGLDRLDLLSVIPPTQRAQVAEYDRRLKERRRELGLPSNANSPHAVVRMGARIRQS